MPTYEYECTKCGRVFEEFQSITAKPYKTIACQCVQCNNRAPVVRRIGAGSGIIFKGNGFYLTDYRSESYKKAAKAEQEAASAATTSKSDPGGAKGKAKSKAPKSSPPKGQS